MHISKFAIIAIALTAVSTATADEIITEDRTYTWFTPIDFPDNTAIIVSDPINDPQLTFTDNANLGSPNALIVGNLSGESGRLRIADGANFHLEYNFPDVTLGPYGAHTVRVGSLYLGLNAGATGSAIIAGLDDVRARTATVGHAGDGSLHISNSGQVLIADAWIGSLPGSTGIVTVASSYLRSSDFEIGVQGEGELHISNSSRVEASDTSIGRFADSQGSTFVSGSRFETRGRLAVGQSGMGTLHADNGSYVESNLAYIGQNAGSHGTATISGMDANGTRSHWETSQLIVGGDGQGTLDITDGALVTSYGTQLGTPFNPASRITVSGVHASGTPSTLQSEIRLQGHNSELQILDGGIVSGLVHAGFATGSVANVTVSGVHASGQRSTLNGGYFGIIDTANLTVSDGGLVTGFAATSRGTISVSGIHATGIRSTIETENFGITTGSITDGGLVTTRAFAVSETELIVSGKHHTGVRSELNVQWWGNIGWEGAPASLIALDGALIQYHSGATIADNAVVTSSGVGSEVFFNDLDLEAGATLQALAGGAIHLHVDADLDGTIELQDGGTLYADGTPWPMPVLSLSSSALITGDGGTLVGNVMSRGTIAPGNSTGVLTIDGDLQNFGTIILELAGLADFDQLLISGALMSNNGSIQIELLDGFSPHSGAEFQVMQFAELTLFGETNLADVFDFSSATLAPGLSWDFSDFATTGTIRVVPEPSTLVLGTLALLGGVWLRRRSMLRHS